MATFGDLANSGAVEVLRESISVLRKRGWVQGVTRDLETGSVDLLGAIAIAAGAPIMQVDDRPDLLLSAVPEARQAAAMVAWEALEWACDEDDPVAWQDFGGRRLEDVVKVINKAADRLQIAVR